MYLNYLKGIFSNYIRAFPSETDRMFLAVEYIVNNGTGGNLLDQISKKTFKDTSFEYINRLKKETLKNEENLFIVFETLISWYETWKNSFNNFNIKNAHLKYADKPIHTWLHCLLTGQQEIYMNIIGEEYISIEKSKWEELASSAHGFNHKPMPIKEVKDEAKTKKIERLLKLYEEDSEFRIKEMLFDKKIAVFLEGSWLDEQVADLTAKYHLNSLKQFSSINPLNDTGNFDYYLFLTSQASHSAKYKLESRVSRDKIFFVSATNYKLAIEEFIRQLKGCNF